LDDFFNQLSNASLFRIVGGFALVVGSVAGFVASLVKEKFSKKLEKKNQAELQLLKAKLDGTASLVELSSRAMTSTYLSANQALVEHHQNIWDSMLQIKKWFNPNIFFANTVLTREEYLSLDLSSSIGRGASQYDYNGESLRLGDIFDKAHKSRPFVDASVWNIFYVYNALHGRISILTFETVTDKNRRYWLDDVEFIKNIVLMAIPEKEFNLISRNQVLAFSNCVSFLEIEFQKATQNLLFGRKLTEETVQLVQRMRTIESTGRSAD
jgi:hypothetical protein